MLIKRMLAFGPAAMKVLLVSLPARVALLSYHLGAEGDMGTVSGRAPEPSMMQLLNEVPSPKLKALAKILYCQLL